MIAFVIGVALGVALDRYAIPAIQAKLQKKDDASK